MRQRVLQGAPATLRVTLSDQDGSPAAASGALTVTVTADDGTVVLAAGTAATADSSNTGVYTVLVPASATAALTLLTAVWADSARSITTQHEVVGGYFFSLAEARNSNDGALANEGKYSDADIFSARQAVEEEAEDICAVSFVPRYARVKLSGGGTNQLVLPHARLRTVRSVWTYPIPGGATYVALTAAQLAGLAFTDGDGTIRRTDYGIFDDGTNNIVAVVEHGWASPPQLVKDAALIRLRSMLTRGTTGIGERATSYTADNGQTYKIGTASVYQTGIPEVDAAYGKYSLRSRGGGQIAASRPWNLDPQRYSVFHGGVR